VLLNEDDVEPLRSLHRLKETQKMKRERALDDLCIARCNLFSFFVVVVRD